jgi:hypothetical protein
MKTKLKPKEAKFLVQYLDGKPLSECAKLAGFKGTNNHSLSQIGYEALKRVDIQMPEILDLCGVTDHLLATKTLEGLNAERPTYAIFKGQFIDERRDPDHSARAKYLELAGRFKGKFIDKHELTGKDGGELTLVIAPAALSMHKQTLEIEE